MCRVFLGILFGRFLLGLGLECQRLLVRLFGFGVGLLFCSLRFGLIELLLGILVLIGREGLELGCR